MARPLSRERMLEELAETAAPRGFLIACDLLRDRAAAEDAVQEALTRGWESFDRLRDPSASHGWFFRILVNLCLRSLRRQRTRRVLLNLWHRPPTPDCPAAEVDERIDREQHVSALLGALGDLPPRQRAALVLRYGHDLSVAEVADMLGVAEETAKTHLARGLTRLRTKLARTGGPR